MQFLHDLAADPFYNRILVPAFVAGFVSLVVYLITNEFLPRYRRLRLTQSINVITDPLHDGTARFRVVNGGHWTIHGAILYLELQITCENTLHPVDGHSAIITPTSFAPLGYEQLCWSVLPNPLRVPICAQEKQPFAVCKFLSDRIEIPTEQGWPVPTIPGKPATQETPATPEKPGVPARVYLRLSKYSGCVTLVSEDTYPRCFDVFIDPNSQKERCTLTPV